MPIVPSACSPAHAPRWPPASPREAKALLREAEKLWRGPPLADFTYEPFAQATIARLEEVRIGAREELIEAELALARHADAVAELEALVREHPFRERPRGQLMLALYRSGRQADALDAFQQARRTLVEELAVEPGETLRDLEQAILRQDPSLAAPSQPAREPAARRRPVAGRRVRLGPGLDRRRQRGDVRDHDPEDRNRTRGQARRRGRHRSRAGPIDDRGRSRRRRARGGPARGDVRPRASGARWSGSSEFR